MSNQINGQPWREQYNFNNEATTDITGWTTGPTLPGVLGFSQPILMHNKVYLIGGVGASGSTNAVYVGTVAADGTIASFNTTTSFGASLSRGCIVVTNGYIHVIGGYTTTHVNYVLSAPLDSSGNIGSWVLSGTLPATRYYAMVFVTKNRVYLAGGLVGGSASNSVIYANINADGTLGAFGNEEYSLGSSRYGSAVIRTSSRVYLMGGYVGGSNSTSSVYAVVNSDGSIGAWQAGPTLNGNLGWSASVVIKNYAFLLGGFVSAAAATSYKFPIDANGILGNCAGGTSIGVARYGAGIIVTSSRVYVMGGTGGAVLNSSEYASFTGGNNDYQAQLFESEPPSMAWIGVA